MDDVPMSEESSNRLPATALEMVLGNSRCMNMVLEGFCEKHRDEIITVIGREIANRLLQDHRKGSANLFFDDLAEATACRLKNNPDAFFSATAKELADRLLNNPRLNDNLIQKTAGEFARAHPPVSAH